MLNTVIVSVAPSFIGGAAFVGNKCRRYKG